MMYADTIRNNMKHFPELDETGFRKCQVKAIKNLDTSFSENRPKALMARMKRILFLVDTKSLGEQAEREFLAYRPNDENRSFSELYGVRRLKEFVYSR